MKLLIIGKRFYTNRDLIADQFGRQFHLPKIWSETNDVNVIALDYYSHEPIRTVIDACTFHTVNIRGRISAPISAYRYCRETANEFHPDVVISSGDIVTGLVGYRLAASTNSAWFYDVYDDYRYFSLSRYTGLSYLIPKLCRRASGLITASVGLKHLYSTWNSSVTVAENGYDPAVFYPGDKLTSRKKLLLNANYKLLVFTGSIDERFDTELISKVMDTLYSYDGSYRLLHAGVTDTPSELSGEWLISMGPVSQATVVDVIRSADICLAPYASTPLSETCSPCKLAEYMACGQAVIAADVANISQYRSFGVQIYAPGNTEQMVELIQHQMTYPTLCKPNHSLTWRGIAESCLEFIKESLSSKNTY